MSTRNVIETAPRTPLAAATPTDNLLSALRLCAQQLAAERDLATLLDQTLLNLERWFVIQHSMLLMLDESGARLYTVASRGYQPSGIGSEIPLGQGIIGMAARERMPIRISHIAQDDIYSRAGQRSLPQGDSARYLETEIPFPGLSEPCSQLAVPMVFSNRLIGVLYVESPQEMCFTHDHEDALLILTHQVAMAICLAEQAAEIRGHDTVAAKGAANRVGVPLVIRYYPTDSSIFIDNDYLIKGVAGAIFWKLLNDYMHRQRTEFSNRELRIDPSIRLPAITNNLETRLILLQRRLSERCPYLRIEKIRRGRFYLRVERPLKLEQINSAA